jgi:hypothetical protein
MALLALGAAGCAMHKPPPKPPVVQHTATMDLTPGITINALVETRPGFIPLEGQRLLWLRGGKEIVLTGTVQGRTEVLGFSGIGLKTSRLIAADGGPGAPHGKIVGLAASPDGMTLAVAEAEPGRVEIVLRYVISNAGQNSVASFDGDFHAVSLSWLAPNTLAVAVVGDPAAAPPANGGLYLLHVAGAVTVEQVKLSCPISMLSFSPSARYAAGRGDERTPPSLFDSRNGHCRRIAPQGPIRVLGWGSRAVLYSTPGGGGQTPGVYLYDLLSGETNLIAASSSAAAFAAADVVMALGSLDINPANQQPDQRVTAQIASFIPKQATKVVDSLGIPTTPAMLMASTMSPSQAFAELALELYTTRPEGPMREIVTFSIVGRKAFVLARGPARGTAVIGWWPGTNHLVIFDGDGATGALAVLTPER